MKGNLGPTKGMTLVEVMLALTVMTTGMLGTLSLFSAGLNAVLRNRAKLTAAVLAQDLLEEILTKAWQDPVTPGEALGPDTGESRSGATPEAVFDDMDDYNNFNESPPTTVEGDLMNGTAVLSGQTLPDYGSYRRSVVVEYVDEDLSTSTVSQTDYKRITVTVGYSTRGNFIVSQIVARHE